MNGRAAKRIRRAARQVLYSSRREDAYGKNYRQSLKRLKREYKTKPYHHRNPTSFGYVSLTHADQFQRWKHMRGIQ